MNAEAGSDLKEKELTTSSSEVAEEDDRLVKKAHFKGIYIPCFHD